MKRGISLLLMGVLLLCAACSSGKEALPTLPAPEGESVTALPTVTAGWETESPTAVPTEAPTASEPTSAPPSGAVRLYVTGDGVNVRAGAGTDKERLTTLAQNTPVNGYQEENGWRYIEYASGRYGYMLSRFLGNEPVPRETPAPFVAPNEPKYNSNTDINDNVFLDALEYTGYNLAKHRADGNMWVFILGKYKQGMGYLSGLGYDYGVTSGYEVNEQGYPDIARMKKNGGMVCASYVTYVYFNYLPHVAGIDTSHLTRPENSCSAQSWRLAAEDWVAKGLSRKISFAARRNNDGTIVFKPAETVPTGSIVVFKKYGASDWADARHVCIYAANAGGYHWMTHVGNERGPEMVTIEHMGFSGTPEVPLEIITPPISFS